MIFLGRIYLDFFFLFPQKYHRKNRTLILHLLTETFGLFWHFCRAVACSTDCGMDLVCSRPVAGNKPNQHNWSYIYLHQPKNVTSDLWLLSPSRMLQGRDFSVVLYLLELPGQLQVTEAVNKGKLGWQTDQLQNIEKIKEVAAILLKPIWKSLSHPTTSFLWQRL